MALIFKNINNISLKFIMLTDNNQIFRNWFVIIHRHLTKVLAQIIQCIIFERNELSITLSALWYNERIVTAMSLFWGFCWQDSHANDAQLAIFLGKEAVPWRRTQQMWMCLVVQVSDFSSHQAQ